MTDHSQADRKGLLGTIYGAVAFTIWGVGPLYWRALSVVSPAVILVHRIVWSAVLLSIYLTLGRRWPVWRKIVRVRRNFLFFAIGPVLLGANWFIYIWAIANDHVVDASLGYFINPLFIIFLGVVFFRERLSRVKKLALLLAAAGVVVLTASFGKVPWVALTLALTFGVYGMIKKLIGADSFVGLHVECALLAPMALAYLLFVPIGQPAFGPSPGIALLLLSSSLLTVLPLVLFSQSTQLIPLSEVGFLQYIAPSLSLAIGVFVFGEDFGVIHGVSFGLIWLALVLSSVGQAIEIKNARLKRESA